MTKSDLAAFRAQIESHLAELDTEDGLGQSGQAPVTLDQQAVGRLSRMDALQNQAMAKATGARRQAERARLKAALLRLEHGEFGYCEGCGEEIQTGRLKLDPAVLMCVVCARG